MFIERFFNPLVTSNDVGTLCNKKDAILYCVKNGVFIRHYSFGSNLYIKSDGNNLIWSDGSKVDKRKLPKNNGWGKYVSELHNLCTF